MRKLIALSVLVLLFAVGCTVSSKPVPQVDAQTEGLVLEQGGMAGPFLDFNELIQLVLRNDGSVGARFRVNVRPGYDLIITKGAGCLWSWTATVNNTGGTVCLKNPVEMVRQFAKLRAAGMIPSLVTTDLYGITLPQLPEHRYLVVLEGEYFEGELTVPEIRQLVRDYQSDGRKEPIFFPSVKLGRPAFRTMPWRLTYVGGCKWHWENYTPEDERYMRLMAEGDVTVCDLAGSDLLAFWLAWH